MATSSNHQQSNNRNRNRSRSRNRNNRNSSGGGSNQRRFVKQKVPRRNGKPSLWERLLSFLGLGSKRPSPPQRPSREKSRSGPKSTAKKQSRPQDRKRNTKPKNSSPPERVAINSARLYVGNLSYATKGDELATLFEKFGTVERSEIVYHRRSNRSKGYAFVEMNDEKAARKAADALHDYEFMGRKIIVNGAKSAGPQDAIDD